MRRAYSWKGTSKGSYLPGFGLLDVRVRQSLPAMLARVVVVLAYPGLVPAVWAGNFHVRHFSGSSPPRRLLVGRAQGICRIWLFETSGASGCGWDEASNGHKEHPFSRSRPPQTLDRSVLAYGITSSSAPAGTVITPRSPPNGSSSKETG